jgi:hypothetical protein
LARQILDTSFGSLQLMTLVVDLFRLNPGPAT